MSPILNAGEVLPGDILFDRTGRVSDSIPATYVVLGAEKKNLRWEWHLARFRAFGGRMGWMGAPVCTFWDEDLLILEKVGRLPVDHLPSAQDAESFLP